MSSGLDDITPRNAGRIVPQDASSHRGLAVWCTGLSGAGKSTLCRLLESILLTQNYRVQVLDGDEIRKQLSKDLGFSKEDRDEQIRRIGVMAHGLVQQGTIVLVAAISPYRAARLEVRQRIGRLIEVYVNAPLHTCIERDPKKLYALALHGKIESFTGISDPYEHPLEPDVECKTDVETTDESAAKVLMAIQCELQRLNKTTETIVANSSSD
jgi:adenylylsulfate kinase